MRTLLAVLMVALIVGCTKGEIENDEEMDLSLASHEPMVTDELVLTDGPRLRPRVARGLLRPQVIDALNDDNSPAKIEVRPHTIVVQMATWCPFSRQVVDFLNDPAVQSRRRGHQLVFVFDDDEWPYVEKNLREAVAAGDFDTGDVAGELAALKENAGYARVYDPGFLELLPEGSKYYFLAKDSPIQGDSYPLVYDRKDRRFSQKAMEALGSAFFPEDVEAFVELWIKHLPEAAREQLNAPAAEASSGS